MPSRPRISIDLPGEDRNELKRLAEKSRLPATRLATIAAVDMLNRSRRNEPVTVSLVTGA